MPPRFAPSTGVPSSGAAVLSTIAQGSTPGTPAIVGALASGTALATPWGMRYLSRPKHLLSALPMVDTFIALRVGESITRPRVDLVATVPLASVADITRVVSAAATLRSVVSSH